MRLVTSRIRFYGIGLLLLILSGEATGQRQSGGTTPPNASRTLTVVTEPNAIIWLDEIRRGTSDLNGRIALATVSSRQHTMRVRANGFKEAVLPLTPAQIDEAIGAFNRAIRESHGFQPEAHVGLGRIYEDKGQYDLAAREYDIAVKQLSDTEPIIYQLLGAAYEKGGKNKEAVLAYENY